jgi:hypothetical protein
MLFVTSGKRGPQHLYPFELHGDCRHHIQAMKILEEQFRKNMHRFGIVFLVAADP